MSDIPEELATAATKAVLSSENKIFDSGDVEQLKLSAGIVAASVQDCLRDAILEASEITMTCVMECAEEKDSSIFKEKFAKQIAGSEIVNDCVKSVNFLGRFAVNQAKSAVNGMLITDNKNFASDPRCN